MIINYFIIFQRCCKHKSFQKACGRVTNLVNGVKQPDGSIKALTPRQVADLLGHSTSQITEQYYVKRDNSRLVGATDEFEL